LLFILWTYGFYPFVIRFLSRRYGKPVHKGEVSQKISIIIPTYNEAESIEKKIKNTLELEYPGLLEIFVVDSNSSDNTVQIAKSFKDVTVISEQERLGKTHALNRVLQETTGEIVVITDANCFSMDKTLLIQIAQNFFDQSIGAVTVPMQYDSSTLETDSAFWKRERTLWSYESILDSIPSGIG